VSGDSGKEHQRGLLHRVRAASLRRIDDWLHSDLLHRLKAADVINRGLLFAGVLLLCFFPFLLVLQSLAGREHASAIVRRFGLTSQAAHAIRQVLTSPSATSTTVTGLSWVFLILGGLAAAGALQDLYERVFEVKGRGLRGTPRRVIWLAATLGVSLLGAWTQPWLDRVGGTGLVLIATLPVATAFWWFSMWLLLAGKLGWRELFPSALATGICWLGMVVVFRLTLSSTIASNYMKYGPAGVVFAIMTYLIAIGVVIILGALLGVAWRARHEHPPGEKPQQDSLSAGLIPAPVFEQNLAKHRNSRKPITARRTGRGRAYRVLAAASPGPVAPRPRRLAVHPRCPAVRAGPLGRRAAGHRGGSRDPPGTGRRQPGSVAR
jgi:membrane protein